jgi:hypothetical protein
VISSLARKLPISVIYVSSVIEQDMRTQGDIERVYMVQAGVNTINHA